MLKKKRLAKRSACRRRQQRTTRLMVESLEARTLLAADVGCTLEPLPTLWADYAPPQEDHVHGLIVVEPGVNPWVLTSLDIEEPGAEFQIQNRWTSTATNGSGLSQGDPTTLTWSFVDDGTSIPGSNGEPTSGSNLIGTLDTLHGAGPGGSDLTQRPWFGYFEDAFARMGEVSGLTYVYEANDDGATFSSSSGVLGVRGDIRLSGHYIDGQSGTNTLAYNFYPNNGDMVIDTSNTTFFGGTANDARGLRNVVMHENGHGIGLRHVESSTSAFLMEPTINTSFDGPQLDDLLALQRNYGDALEKNGGNNTSATAVNLGSIGFGQSVSRGTLGNSTVVSATATDYISIDDESDVDFFKFTVSANSAVTLTLTPRGATYQQGPQGGTQTSFIAAAQSDLTLQLRGTNGTTILQTANATGQGGSELISEYVLSTAGTYFVQVSGATSNMIQLYGLDVSVTSAVATEPPVLSQPANQTLNSNQTLPVTLSVSDPDTPAANLIYTASYEDQGYLLDQQYNLAAETTTSYNWGGQQEKWLKQSGGTTWYFILPNGNFYRWGGGTPAQLLSNSTLLAQVHTIYYTTTTRLSSPTSIAAGAPVNNSSPPAVLSVDPPDTFVGTLRYQVSVSDGANSDAKTFYATVNQATTAPEIQVLDGTADIPDAGTVNFGSTPVGTAVTKTLTVRNLGTANLTLTQLTQNNMPNGYTLVAGFGSLSLAAAGAAGDSTTFQIQLNATNVATYSGPVSFGNNDSNENPFDLALSGVVTGGTAQPPVLAQPSNVTLNNNQTLPVTLAVTDPDTAAANLIYTASYEDQGYLLDQQYSLAAETTTSYNWGGQQEKWLKNTSGTTWYFILPNGDFYRWGGGTPAQMLTTSTLLAQLHTAYYTTTTRLSSPTSIAASVPVNNSSPPAVLTVDPPNTFVGTLRYQVSVSDGTASDAKTFYATVNQGVTTSQPPVLAQPANQTISSTQTLGVTLSVTDPDTPATNLSYSASFDDYGYALKQQYGFGTEQTGSYNWGGQQEKWFRATSGTTVTWYFITPNGNFYRWGGGTPAQLLTTSTLLAQLHTVYYTNSGRLGSPTSIASTAPVNNNNPPAVLTVDPPDTFTGTLRYQVSVSDGTASDSKTFFVTVN